ncbi:MAG: hypothetical protein E7262_11060 [Lachnospiraceae bacterium]|nr:hypothetical protein [Lachnospiraceae bacterium]
MKISYLPKIDRQALRLLRQAESIEEVINILVGVVSRKVVFHSLMEYQKWFFMISQEQLIKNPELIYGKAMIFFLQGELQEAGKLRNLIDSKNKYALLYDFLTSSLTLDEMAEHVEEIADVFPEDFFQLTVKRPCAINGLWDFTCYGEDIINGRAVKLEKIIRNLYGEEADDILDIMKAECLYQQNKCYEALVILLGKIPKLERKKDIRLLFVALTLETYIMIINGQASSTHSLMDNLRKKTIVSEKKLFLDNVNALDAWAAMYDGEYMKLSSWLKEEAPDEISDFSFLDLFRYMVKIRTYIIQGKYLAVTKLAMRVMPLLEEKKRYMDMCELHMLWALSEDAAGRIKESYKHIEKMLELSSKYRYDRLIADEGMRMYQLLKKYTKDCGKSKYLAYLIKLTENTAMLHIRYLKSQLPENVELTPTELKVIRLVAECYTNKEISDVMGIALDTVKQHCSHIFSKLDVKNRQKAIKVARDIGIIG